MAAQGTPQNYLYNKRPSMDSYRDRSMEQYYTPSGNPYGYQPSPPAGPSYSGYTPPMISGGKWGAQAFAPRSNQFTLPGATNGVTPGYVPPPGASPYMPNFQSFQNQMQQVQSNPNMTQYNPQGTAANPNPTPAMPNPTAVPGNTGVPLGSMTGGLPAGPAAAYNVSQMMQQFAAQHQPAPAPQPNPALNNPAYSGLQRTANFVPQMNPQSPPSIDPNNPNNNAAFLLGNNGGLSQGIGRSYAPMLQR